MRFAVLKYMSFSNQSTGPLSKKVFKSIVASTNFAAFAKLAGVHTFLVRGFLITLNTKDV